ncbi:rRNA maturation factor [Planoprotostelium fungivorum]|uniref:rRNA maturation factor n=1 Tax=Planoprotostelium fungivorum TaxID=1890364 RepID=A0A2P6MRE4_9EUKA|nr:rRNA maturation factor [Planoprotostelium fungivorum]
MSLLQVLNKQKVIPINTPLFRKKTEVLVKHLAVSEFSVRLEFIDVKAMQKLNKRMFGLNRPTDVISVPTLRIKPPNQPKPLYGMIYELGDISICPEHSAKYAERDEMEPYERLDVLLVHSLCHLMGYEHEKDSDYILMDKKEKELLNVLSDFKTTEKHAQLEEAFKTKNTNESG